MTRQVRQLGLVVVPDYVLRNAEARARWIAREAQTLELDEASRDALADLVEEQAGEVERDAHPPLRLLGLEDLRARARESAWLVKTVLDRDSIGLIYGPPSSLKTFLALDVAIRIAAGMEVWGCEARPGPVVYFVGEAQRETARRVLAAVQDWPESSLAAVRDRFRLVEAVPDLTSSGDVSRVVDALAEFAPALVVIDTLALAMPGCDENAAGEVGLAVQGLRALRDRLKCAVVALHHTTKDGKAERGSSALRGGADVMIRIDRGERSLEVRAVQNKSRGAEPPPFRILLAPVALDGTNDEGEPLGSSLRVVQAGSVHRHELEREARDRLTDAIRERLLRDARLRSSVAGRSLAELVVLRVATSVPGDFTAAALVQMANEIAGEHSAEPPSRTRLYDAVTTLRDQGLLEVDDGAGRRGWRARLQSPLGHPENDTEDGK